MPENTPAAATRPWRWPTYSRVLLENEYQRDFIRGQQAQLERLRAERDALLDDTLVLMDQHTSEEVKREARLRIIERHGTLAGDGE